MAIEENSAAKTKKLVELKTALEKKVEDTETELRSLKALLELVSEALLEKGFRRAEALKPNAAQTAATETVIKEETTVPLKSASGNLLANLHVTQNSMRVTVAGDKELSVKTPPFQQFLVDRVLKKMQEKDDKAVEEGKISRDKCLSYELAVDGDILREIKAKNLSADRLRELKSSIHWTLEKMYEKT
ncbi:MAG: hypothetical protein JSV64_04680 [Candidatus Bathyarchaeota archaeon]|nr:MAG: hypothetical protein JSV64_04680 [Candidatus Bathyarchaeota archaeon]